MTSEFPLSWPPGFPHIEYPAQSRSDTPEERVRRIWSSRYLMDAMNVVVSTKLRAAPPRPAVFQPEHHGLGCGGLFTRKGREQAIACDKWDSICDNLQAVAKTIETCAGLSVGDGVMVDQFQGFTAIPASATCQNNHPAPVDAASEPSGATQHQHPNHL